MNGLMVHFTERLIQLSYRKRLLLLRLSRLENRRREPLDRRIVCEMVWLVRLLLAWDADHLVSDDTASIRREQSIHLLLREELEFAMARPIKKPPIDGRNDGIHTTYPMAFKTAQIAALLDVVHSVEVIESKVRFASDSFCF
jgi:hypothetical protein